MRVRTRKKYKVKMEYKTIVDFGILTAISKECAIEQAEDIYASGVIAYKEDLDIDVNWQTTIQKKRYDKVVAK